MIFMVNEDFISKDVGISVINDGWSMIGLGLYYPSLLGDYHILGISINKPLQMDVRGF